MEYALIVGCFIIFFCLLLGVGYHVGEKCLELDKLKPDDSLGDVFRLLWKIDKITILISLCLIIPTMELLFVILHVYWIDRIKPEEIAQSYLRFFDLIFFGASLLVGYAGQLFVYKLLGKAVNYAENKVNEKLN